MWLVQQGPPYREADKLPFPLGKRERIKDLVKGASHEGLPASLFP